MAWNKRGYKPFYGRRTPLPAEFRHKQTGYSRPLSLHEYALINQLMRFWLSQQNVDQRVRDAQTASAAPTPKQSVFDPHEVLGVPKTASKEEISMAYHTKAKQYHPDTVAHLGPEAQKEYGQIMTVINAAYNALK